MDFSPGTRILRENWKLVALTAVLAAVLAYGISYAFAPTYGATSRILVRARETRFLTGTGQDLKSQPGVVDSTLAKSLTQTSSALVKGRAVAEEVVKDLKLDTPKPVDTSILGRVRDALKTVRNYAVALGKYGMYREPASAFDAAVSEVEDNLAATPIKDSYLIEIKATADRPELAAAMADSAANALVRVSQERFKSDAVAYVQFLKGQVDSAQAAVDKVQQQIRAYKEQQKIVNVTEELRLSAGSTETINQMMRETLVDLESARAELASIADAISRVSATEQSSSTVSTGRSSTTTTNTSPNRLYQDLVARRTTAESKVAALEARQTALQQDLAQRSTLLPQQEAYLADLDRQLGAASDTFRVVRSSYDAATLNAAQGAEEVSVSDRASAPLYPEKPLRYLFAIVGAICGIAGGIGLAQLLQRRAATNAAKPDLERDALPLPRRLPMPAPQAAAEMPQAHSTATRQ
jgi:succinoglycan biosynthesis transport protein ExoP